MYTIIQKLNGEFVCECKVQDGVERWVKETYPDAVHSMIQAARVLNGIFIVEYDINFIVEKVVLKNNDLLDSIASGNKVVLDATDPRVRMRITGEECDVIRAIREGEAMIIRGTGA